MAESIKEKILLTAFEQFLKSGIRKMSIPKLTAVLGISSKTVYKYYKNKEELLEEVLKLHYTRLYQRLENLSANQKVVPLFIDIWYMSIERGYNVNNVFYKDLHYYYPELERITERRISEEFWNKFLQILKKGIGQGVFKDDLSPELALESLSVLFNAVTRTEQFDKFSVSPHIIFLNTMALYIRGFCTKKGIQEFDEHIKSLKPLGGMRE